MLHIDVFSTHDASRERLTCTDADLQHQDGVLIGRSKTCAIQLSHGYVSRQHARMKFIDGKLHISDLGSTSGTFVNGIGIPDGLPYPVPPGATISIGPFEVMCSHDGSGLSDDSSLVPRAIKPTQVLSPEEYQPLACSDIEAIPLWQQGTLTLRCQHITRENSHTKTFAFVAHPLQRFVYLPGQFITLHLQIDGQDKTRSYSISSTPTRPHTLTITVKLQPARDGHPSGKVSTWLHHHLKVGDHLTASGPYGEFSPHHMPFPRLCCIAAGSGISPMIAIMRWYADSLSQANIHLVAAARHEEDLIARQEIDLLCARHDNLQVQWVLSQPQQPESWAGEVGHLDIQLITRLVPDIDERRVFVCTPAGLTHLLRQQFSQAGFPMGRFHQESYGGPLAQAVALESGALQAHSGAVDALSATNEYRALVARESGKHSQETSSSTSLEPAQAHHARSDDRSQSWATESEQTDRFSAEGVLSMPPLAPPLAEPPAIRDETEQTDRDPSLPVLYPNEHAEPLSSRKHSSQAPGLSEDPREATTSDEVVLLTSKRTIPTNGKTILEAAEQAGLRLPFGCRSGTCGSCKARMVQGAIYSGGYRDDILTPEERAEGYILTCCAKANGTCSIEA